MATSLSQALIGTEGLIAPQKPKDLFASLLIKNALSTEPVKHWTQGAARMAQALMGGLELRGQESDENARRSAPDEIAAVAGRLGLGGMAPTSAPPVQSQPPMQRPLPTPSVAPPTNDPAMGISPQQAQRANAITWADGQTGEPGQLPPPGAAPNFNDRFSAAFPTQASSRPVQTAQVSQQSAPTAAPDLMSAAQELRKSKNPYVKAYGTQLMLQEITRSPEFEIKTDNGVTIAVDKRNPRNRHIIDDPALAQTLLQRKAEEQYGTTFAGEQAKRDVAKPDRDRQTQRYGGVVIDEIDTALDRIENPRPGMPATGPTTMATRHLPWTNAGGVAQMITTIKGNITFDRLQAMRESSPTGGALGAVTKPELDMLGAAVGSLEQAQDEKDLSARLKRVKNIYLDIIHGPGGGPGRSQGASLPRSQSQQSAAPQGGQRPRAHNPQTGQVIEFDGAQWVPAR